MLPSINNERDEDILEASVSQEFIMVNQDRSGVRKYEKHQNQ
jgi:hypothetical protein